MPRWRAAHFRDDLPARLARAARLLAAVVACALALGVAGAAASRATGLQRLGTAFAGFTDGTSRYVNQATGNDNGGDNNCASAATPCATIDQAVSVSSSGDTIQIAAGTYDEIVKTSLNLTFVGAGASGPDATIVNSSGLTYSDGNPYGAFALSGTDTVEDLTAEDLDSGIGGAVSVSGAGAVALDGVNVYTDGQTAGTDGIGAGGQSLTVEDSHVDVINNDADVANSSTSSDVVQDGSGIEAVAGTVSVSDSTISTVDGIALRLHAVTGATGPTSTTVKDSLLEVSGTEDIASGQTGNANDQWQTIEAAAGSLTLISDTIYNATVGRSTSSPQAPTDALWVAPVSGLQVTIDNSILRAQQQLNYYDDGSDIDANESVSASFSSFSSVYAHGDATVTANDADGNIPGDPGFNDAAAGDFTLAPGSALIGAGDPSAVSPGELDLAGDNRASSCLENGSDTPTYVLNVGAYETSAASCPTVPSSGDSTGALTQLSGAFDCVTGQSADGSPCATSGVPGMTGDDPNDVVQSPDGQNVYVASEDPSGDGVDIAEFSRGAGGGLSQLPVPNNCLSSAAADTTGCGMGSVTSLDYSTDNGENTPIVLPARMAISPDGTDLYIDTGLEIAGFTRDPSTGALTPFPASECISFASSSGPGSQCAVTNDEELFGGPAALAFSPDGSSLYLATTDSCSHGESPLRARAASEASETLAGDPQNPNCANNSQDAFFASAQLDLLSRDPSSGALTQVACYANSATREGCTGGFDGLYAITSVAVSPDGRSVYATGDAGGTPDPNAGVDGVPLGDPGQISELVRDPADGTLTPAGGAGACITAGSQCDPTAGNGTTEVPGLIDPQQIVVSPDGDDAYVVSSQYYSENLASDVDTGVLVSSDVVSLTRDPTSGALAPISDANCFAGFEEACASDEGPYQFTVQIPGLQGAESLAISPDGQNVYVASGQASVVNGAAQFSGAVAFSRGTDGGSLTPLSPPDTCLAGGMPSGAAGVLACGDTSVAGLSGAFGELPGWILVSPDCTNAYVLSSALAEFARAQPAGVSCPIVGGGGGGTGAISLNPTSLTFGSGALPVVVGSASAPQHVTITDTGTASVTMGTLSIAGGVSSPFSIQSGSDTCSGQTLAVMGSCTVSIVFTPATAGAASDQLLVPSSAGAAQMLALSGTGATGGISLSPTALTFASSSMPQQTGTASAPQKLTITNTAAASVAIGTLSIAGGSSSPFSIQAGGDGCSGQTLAASGSCTVSILFTPQTSGAAADQLVVPSSAGAAEMVDLSGFASSGSISLSTTGLNFGTVGLPVTVGSASALQTVTITDPSTVAVTLGTLSIAGGAPSPFAIVQGQDGCSGQTLASGGSCTVAIVFNPQSANTVGDQLLVPNSAGATQKLGLTGVGGQGQATPSVTLLSFGTSGGEIAVGTTSPAQKVTVTDGGREPVTFGTLSITAGSPFQLSADGCSRQTLQPSGTCSVMVAMAPTSAGAFGAALTIPDNAPTAGSQQTVVLKGDAAVAAISLDMTSLQWSGIAYQVKTVTVTNPGPALLSIGSVGVSTAGTGPAAFSLASSSDCSGTSLAPNATCTIGADFTPVSPGAETGTVDVNDDVPGSPQTVALSGSAAGGTLSGTVTGPGGGSLAGVGISACTAGEGPGSCAGTNTAADGSYSLSLVSGTWRLQLSALSGYDDASAVDQVLPGQTVTQDFSLHAPIALSGGVSFNGPGGAQDSGVPTVNWEQPFAINQPVTVSPTGPANSTQIYYDVSGIGDDTGTISGSAFNLAGLAVFGVRYGPDGQAEGMTDPLEGEIDCQPAAGSPSPCSALIPDPSSLPAGTSQLRGALRAGGGSGAAGGVDAAAGGVDVAAGGVDVAAGGVDVAAGGVDAAAAGYGPTAHAAIDCPAAAKVGFNIVPDKTYGGVDFVYTDPDGTQHVFILGNVAIAPLSSTGNAFADGALNVGRLGINFALNFNPYIGAYNAFINALQSLTISAHSNNMQLQGLENGNAIIQLLVAALNAETHGAAYWVGQVFSGIFSYSANYENGLQVQATPNCPPKSNDFYIDPSGTVQTTKKVPVDGATVTLKRSATAAGKLGRVPAGSTLLSPANRRNPDHSTVTGAFGWDVAPGYYTISASRSGCRSPKAHGGSAATTPLLGVPPEQTNLTLTLSCPHLRRSASRVALSVIAGPDGMHALRARVTAKGHGTVAAGDLVGSITFRAGGRSLGAVPIDLSSGAATLDVPSLKTAVKSFAATYSGNGLYAPSTTNRSSAAKPAKKKTKH